MMVWLAKSKCFIADCIVSSFTTRVLLSLDHTSMMWLTIMSVRFVSSSTTWEMSVAQRDPYDPLAYPVWRGLLASRLYYTHPLHFPIASLTICSISGPEMLRYPRYRIIPSLSKCPLAL